MDPEKVYADDGLMFTVEECPGDFGSGGGLLAVCVSKCPTACGLVAATSLR